MKRTYLAAAILIAVALTEGLIKARMIIAEMKAQYTEVINKK